MVKAMQLARFCVRWVRRMVVLALLIVAIAAAMAWARSLLVRDVFVHHSYRISRGGVRVDLDAPRTPQVIVATGDTEDEYPPFPGATFWWRWLRIESSRGGMSIEYRIMDVDFPETHRGDMDFGDMVGDLRVCRDEDPFHLTDPPAAYPRLHYPDGAATAGFGWAMERSGRYRHYGVIVPYWAILLLASLYPLWRARPMWIRRRRRRLGQCLRCGYDLRATPDVCPECGDVQPGGSAPRAPVAGADSAAVDT